VKSCLSQVEWLIGRSNTGDSCLNKITKMSKRVEKISLGGELEEKERGYAKNDWFNVFSDLFCIL